MYKIKWLQFFAEGSATSGGDGGAEGVSSADPGQNLEDLGVPKELADRHRRRKGKAVKTEVETEPVAQRNEEVPQTENAPTASMSWDDFMKVPENNQRMQQMMSDRLKKQGKANEEFMSKLSPALELLSTKYGIEVKDGKIDAEALANAVIQDDTYYEDRALEMGVDTETAKRIVQLEQEKQRNDEERIRQERDLQLRAHFMGMQSQANELQALYPDFNLERELQNPEFRRLTSPDVGMSVKGAFYSMHGDEIMEKQASAIAQRAKVDAANAIMSGKRPRENGGSAVAPATSTPNIHNMSREERLAYIKNKYASPR